MGYIKRKCDNCGKEYFVCRACEKSGSWKNVCCSRSCFRELIRKKTEKEKEEVVSSKEEAKETPSLVQETEKVSDKVVVDLNLEETKTSIRLCWKTNRNVGVVHRRKRVRTADFWPFLPF